MTRFQVKYSGKDKWEAISEKAVMEKLVDRFNPVAPIISKMLRGEEIATSHEIYRINNREFRVSAY